MSKLNGPKARWQPFPNPDPHFEYESAALRRHWPRLHRGDREPYPDAGYLEKLAAAHRALVPLITARDAAAKLQDAWRAFHRGSFREAVALGLAVGRLGYNVANKAANIYATYLERREDAAIVLFREAASRAEDLQRDAPMLANAWYFHAQALGRYAQRIPIGAAMAEGLADKIKASLDKTIELEPGHADARIALGAFEAEILGKLGPLLASITYGASKNDAIANFREALRLDPDSAIGRVEFGDALVKLYGRGRRDEADRLYREAVGHVPADAMEYLDVSLAQSKLLG